MGSEECSEGGGKERLVSVISGVEIVSIIHAFSFIITEARCLRINTSKYFDMPSKTPLNRIIQTQPQTSQHHPSHQKQPDKHP